MSAFEAFMVRIFRDQLAQAIHDSLCVAKAALRANWLMLDERARTMVSCHRFPVVAQKSRSDLCDEYQPAGADGDAERDELVERVIESLRARVREARPETGLD